MPGGLKKKKKTSIKPYSGTSNQSPKRDQTKKRSRRAKR